MLLNKARAMEKMRQYGFVAMIATHPENVNYVTDHQGYTYSKFRFLGACNHAVIGSKEDIPSALVIPPGDAGWVAAYPPSVDEIYIFGHGAYTIHEGVTLDKVESKYASLLEQREKYGFTAADALVKCLKDRGITAGKVGLDEKNLNPATRERLTSELPHIEFIDAFELFRVIRMVKTPEEIERLRQAASINEKALSDLMANFRVGVTEDELARVFRKSTVEQGAFFEFLHANTGRRASYPLSSSGIFDPPSDYQVQKGDLYKFDGGSSYRKYHSDTGHCFLAGESNPYVEKIHQVIKDTVNSVREIILPRVKTSAVCERVVKAMAQGGIENYRPFCGHGIGIEARDYPTFLTPVKSTCPYFPGSTDFSLEANMVINIEFPYQELGHFGMQMEHSLLVTQDGNELLIPQNRELRVLSD